MLKYVSLYFDQINIYIYIHIKNCIYTYIHIMCFFDTPFKKRFPKQSQRGNTLRSPAAGAPMARKPAKTEDLWFCFVEVILRLCPEDLNGMLFLDLEAHEGAGFPMASQLERVVEAENTWIRSYLP